ncbi:hypothetical protein AYK26_05320 [Euryarchaeota archaeon SM23-78]|nr:MAG: hypothetical protein AYK26_05320 [Euryarchaeota archaeon SM23-78]MBW3000966.1 sulfotransferase [Candidatus Woesearchaeota archaeon]
MYLHFKTWVRITWLMLFHKPRPRRILFFIGFALLFGLVFIIVAFFRLLDEIFFPRYRKQKIKEPVFIFGNPRSGTTFLYDLMALDKKKFTQPILYQTLFCSITLYKAIGLIIKIDKRIGRPIKYCVNKFNQFFIRYEGIHRVSMDKPEEDEPLFFLSLTSPTLWLICPYPKELSYLEICDNLPTKTRRRIMKYYKRSLQRFMYMFGKNRTYLCKNVFSTGKIDMITSTFPDARIIYPIRHPYKAIPSLVSFFRTAWKLHSPKIKEKSPETRAVARLCINYYKHIFKNRHKWAKKNFIVIRFDDLVKNPNATIINIYKKLGVRITPAYTRALNKFVKEQERYKSKHKYLLEEFGLSKKTISKELKQFINSYL